MEGVLPGICAMVGEFQTSLVRHQVNSRLVHPYLGGPLTPESRKAREREREGEREGARDRERERERQEHSIFMLCMRMARCAPLVGMEYFRSPQAAPVSPNSSSLSASEKGGVAPWFEAVHSTHLYSQVVLTHHPSRLTE